MIVPDKDVHKLNVGRQLGIIAHLGVWFADGDSWLVHINHEQREGVTGPTKKHDISRGDRVGDPPLYPIHPPAAGDGLGPRFYRFHRQIGAGVRFTGGERADELAAHQLRQIVGSQLAANLVKRLAH